MRARREPDAVDRVLGAAGDVRKAIRAAAPQDREALLEWLIERLDQGRFDHQGGYPSAWRILKGGALVMATLTYDERPELIVSTPLAYLLDHQDWFEDELSERDAAKRESELRAAPPPPPK